MILLTSYTPAARAAEASTGKLFIQVAAGLFYSVALRKDGTVWTWGRNIHGEMGTEKTPTKLWYPYPIRLQGLTDIVSISVDGIEGYQLAVKKDGTVWEWGKDPLDYGESVLPRQVKGLSGVKAVASYDHSALALLQDGTVVSWIRKSRDDMADVKPTRLAGLSNIASLTVNHAIARDGSLYTWPFKYDQPHNNWVTGEPFKLAGLTNIRKAVGSSEGGYAIDAKGQVWSWLIDSQASTASTAKMLAYRQKPTRVFSGYRVKDFAFGYKKAQLLTEDGALYSITASGKAYRTTGLPALQAFSAESYHTLALDREGHIWGWGANQWYETGSETSAPDGMVYKPVQVKPGVDVFVNGQLFSTIVPSIEAGGTAWLPIKLFAPAAGIRIDWLTPGGGYTLTKDDKTLTVQFIDGKLNLKLNGEQLNDPIISGLYRDSGTPAARWQTAPYQLLTYLGLQADWDAKTHELYVSK